mgnify:FL=1
MSTRLTGDAPAPTPTTAKVFERRASARFDLIERGFPRDIIDQVKIAQQGEMIAIPWELWRQLMEKPR